MKEKPSVHAHGQPGMLIRMKRHLVNWLKEFVDHLLETPDPEEYL